MIQNIKIKKNIFALLMIIFLGVLLWHPQAAMAENFLDAITNQYSSNMKSWHAPLMGYAQRIFWLLALIEIVWAVGKLILGKADFGAWAEELMKQFLIIGTFWAFLTHSAEWATAIIQSFRLAGEAANGAAGGVQGLQPTDVFADGVDICTTLLKSFHFTFDINKFMEGLALVFGGFIVLISFCLISALEVVVIIETYVFMYAGVLFLGFGGSHLTSDIAKRYFIGILSVGTKLFTIQLIIGLGQKLLHQWADLVVASNGILDLQLVIQIVGGAIVLLSLAKTIPELAQGMVTGSSLGTVGSLVSSGAAAGSTSAAVAALGASAVGAAMLNPAMAAHFARTASTHANEAFRHTTGQNVLNPMHGFGRGRDQSDAAYTGPKSFRTDPSRDRDIDPNNSPTGPGINNGNSIST